MAILYLDFMVAIKKNKTWKKTAIFTFLIPFLMVVAMYFVSENTPGISKRIGFTANYLFIFILAVKLTFVGNKTTDNNLYNAYAP